MKSRIIWAAILVTAIAGFYAVTIRPTQVSSPGFSRKRSLLNNLRPPEVAPPVLPPVVLETPTLRPPLLPESPLRTLPPAVRRDDRLPLQEVPVQNNATIDYSIGAPVVRSGDKDQESLDRALKEMAEATKDTTFAPKK